MDRSMLFASSLIAASTLVACTSSGSALNPPHIFSQQAKHIVVSDVANNAVVTFPGLSAGSVAPTSTLSGAGTNLNQPEGFFLDRVHGNLWVGNYSGGSGGTVTEYALSASGSTAPMATIGGGSTTLQGPGGIYVDGKGNVYVGDYRAGAIDIFAPGDTTGAPTTQIAGSNTGLTAASGVWLDSRGDVWVGNAAQTSGTDAILEFAPNASGNATPIATISGASTDLVIPMGVFVDARSNVWVANCGPAPGNIEEFAAGASGDAAPKTLISGSSTGLSCPNGIFVDSAGYVYVSDYRAASVYVFSPNSNGNVAPVQTIPANATTGLSKPIGVIAY